MDGLSRVLLNVWREACQHLPIGESVPRMAAALAGHLTVDLLMVRRIDLQRHCLETVALVQDGRGKDLDPPRHDSSPADVERLLLWCRRGEVIQQNARNAEAFLPGLLPPGSQGEVLAGPLSSREGPAGVLTLLLRPPHHLGLHDVELVRELLEPFGVALENDRHLRELNSLREALEADNQALKSRLGRHDISDSIVGSETGLKEVMEQVELVARSDVPVLILGETGSGKEVVARAIHTRSDRAGRPFLRVNCGAIPPDLVDSELFGHERGSFTGAVSVRKGWFERADTGTLFLDECGELPLSLQVRLLRILQDGTLNRVGSEKHQQVDVRIVAATHRNLRSMVTEGGFREDLWYRLAVFPIRLPPLRERLADIPTLAAHFALRAAKRLGNPPLVPTPHDLHLLASYSWPGNVRELAAVIERAIILGEGKCLKLAQALGTGITQPASARGTSSNHGSESEGAFPTLDAAMVHHIEAALQRSRGQIEGVGGAAQLLGVNPHTLRARMRKLHIDWNSFRVDRSPPAHKLRCA